MPSDRPLPRAGALALALGCLIGVTSIGCGDRHGDEGGDKSDGDKVEGPSNEDREQLQREAHREALALALESSRAALSQADPLAAYRAGQGPAAAPPLSFAARGHILEALERAQTDTRDIDERFLEPDSVVILRVIRFGLTRIHDDQKRHPGLRVDPNLPLTMIEETLDELEWRLLVDDCNQDCLDLPGAMAAEIPGLREQLEAASLPATIRAGERCTALAARARGLAERLKAGDQPALVTLADALDTHHRWLLELQAVLPEAKLQTWSAAAPPLRPGNLESIDRLPAALDARAMIRWLSVDERVDLVADRALAEVVRQAVRWRAIETQLLGPGTDPAADGGPDASAPEYATAIVAEDLPTPVTVERCEALLKVLSAGVAGIEDVDAPVLDCERYLVLRGPEPASEGALLLELLDRAVIEPQRRALRRGELAELALVRGQWSEAVHVHLRRIMLLAHIDHRQGRAAALLEGRRALCQAGASLWIHGELGGAPDAPDDPAARAAALAAALGPACSLLDPQQALDEAVADPRAAMVGFGLSLIGDEPARMLGF
ncbi:MAG: hypothetical protein KC431_31365, partial [Myxococcales bacterium]|nr:hypothetical protein [Myxococcales bacterium]